MPTVGIEEGYEEGTADSTIRGVPIMWEDSGDVLRPVSDAKPLSVQQAALSDTVDSVRAIKQGSFTDRSGTTSGTINTSTQVAAANSSRRYFLFQNVSDTDMWINFGTAATTDQPSIKVPTGAVWGNPFVLEAGFVSTEAVNVICSAASKKYTCKEA